MLHQTAPSASTGGEVTERNSVEENLPASSLKLETNSAADDTDGQGNLISLNKPLKIRPCRDVSVSDGQCVKGLYNGGYFVEMF